MGLLSMNTDGARERTVKKAAAKVWPMRSKNLLGGQIIEMGRDIRLNVSRSGLDVTVDVCLVVQGAEVSLGEVTFTFASRLNNEVRKSNVATAIVPTKRQKGRNIWKDGLGDTSDRKLLAKAKPWKPERETPEHLAPGYKDDNPGTGLGRKH